LKRNIIILAIMALSIAGCGTEKRKTEEKAADTNTKTETAGNINANVAANENNTNSESSKTEETGPLVLFGDGKSEAYECKGREVEVDESTTANKFTLSGECKKLKVDGVSNRVYVDKVGEIEVIGTSNKVYYGAGLDGPKPKIMKKGTSLVVEKKKSEEK
jgi:hypothetical protein